MGDFETILRDAQNGSQEAFECLATLYGDMIRNLCRTCNTEVEDLRQELLLALHRAVQKFSIELFEQNNAGKY